MTGACASNVIVIGTDTDCGKTWISSELIRLLRRQHKDCIAIKPIACGLDAQGKNDDLQRLLAIQTELTVDDINLYRFCLAAAPSLAAQAEQKNIDMQTLVQWCQMRPQQLRIIEGVGGLMVPVNESQTGLDWLKQMPDAKLILVVGSRLGCINHTLLSLTALRCINREADWIVLNDIQNSHQTMDIEGVIKPHLSKSTTCIHVGYDQNTSLNRIVNCLGNTE
ncbi:MAG: dethiobiotin synthase [Zetaproteobacteria bacterium CG_4_9_14_3_um_filter_49_83]|nr:MAG: dethiobiotin synthase [Zetaproteobacteria bacterium CG1_02_49_23]PIQ30156.1 MAG: dethiobiotin synthase [Zetaproteobacteria bacterium CG17_big_fil_post_rev_8_21_14_2_50_50_13]PIV30381.1 MAG: dethiobiotin synthase [Zetaproteobacteria bacterium CG02_land_8_20_14_3_00_50_9]PIY54516.1 MAG: dethiobiotin synthase [Zetaproteobacteria bacterium CG_4_10_14_0_8_um_filter_49_80]PJA35156.1 MAG: dethiobiotin synthase [Zetaproteobacteria bacterium CG_4_9_14_3_um_filter_49_83]